MNILIAPNSMKGSLNAFDFADTVEEAILSVSSEFKTRKVPVADGGDFTGEILSALFDAKKIEITVLNPLGRRVNSFYFISKKVAIIEMANASGMKLVDTDLLNPLVATSYGTGEMIVDAIDKNCNQILLAVGGSATVDGGMGMMEALGFRFIDENRNDLPGNGLNLSKIRTVMKAGFPGKVSIKIICDVDNLLLGEKGAAKVFGPQKGATPEMVFQLENGLRNWAKILAEETGRTVSGIRGTGAAGGISVPLISFFNAEIVPGAEFILSLLYLEEHMKWADLVITGEGKIDSQTIYNKAPFAVAQMAKKTHKPVYAFAGLVEEPVPEIFDGVICTSVEANSLSDAMQNARKYLFDACKIFTMSLL